MKLIFDIGACYGDKTDKFSRLAENVIAFEPNPTLYSKLQEKYKNTNVLVDKRAISHIRGTQEFMISDYDYISTLSTEWVNKSRFTDSYSWYNTIPVETITLHDLVDEFGEPDYIKLDIEGYEHKILQNLDIFLSKTLFSFEFVEEDMEKIMETVHYLDELGYKNFGFTFGDEPIFDKNINWQPSTSFSLFDIISKDGRDLWGMIYFKK